MSSPDKTEIFSFDVAKPKYTAPYLYVASLPYYYSVSIKNLSDRAYAVSYSIYGYDAQNRRVAETSDSVTLSAKETVLRQVLFSQRLSVDPTKFASFRLFAYIEE